MVVTSLKDYQGTKFVHNDDSLVFVDQCGIIQYSNSNINNMFGFNQNVLYKKNISLLFPKTYSKNIYTYILGVKNNDNLIPIYISFKKYNFIGVEGVLLRIKKRTQRTELSNIELLKAFKEHANFVSKTSHEIRNPLTTILNATTILNKLSAVDGIAKDIKSKNIIRIFNSIDQLTDILDDFLTINKINAKEKNNVLDLNISSFTKEIIESVKGDNEHQAYIVYTHYGNNHLMIDREMLSSVFYNLLSNAIKYSSKRSVIKFETKIIENELQIICKDYGIGIPLEEQKNLFNRYFRANNTTNIKGTGLGLSIIKEHIEKVGGSIELESKLDVGTTFHITIPLSNGNLSEQIS